MPGTNLPPGKVVPFQMERDVAEPATTGRTATSSSDSPKGTKDL